jgi:hypothetical protein
MVAVVVEKVFCVLLLKMRVAELRVYNLLLMTRENSTTTIR